MASEDRPWFYIEGGVQLGPVSERTVRHMLREDQLAADSMVWTDGMPGWQPANQALPAYVSIDFTAPESATPAAATPVPVEVELPDDTRAYFTVSPTKFIVMSIATGGFYEFYWSYKNWQFIKSQHELRIMPFWRAWFVLFFHYAMIKQVKNDLSARVPVVYHPGWLFVTYIALLLAFSLPEPFSLVSYLSFLPLLPVVNAINSSNVDRVPSEQMNQRFSGWNIAAIVVFGLMQVASFIWAMWPGLLPS